jgi:all-trans-retinol 13,14-reductase
VIVSNAGARITYERLLPTDAGPVVDRCRSDLRCLDGETSAVQLFLGLKQSAEAIGFRGENHWIFSSYDHDAMFEQRNRLLEDEPAMAYLSLPSLKDPEAKLHSAEIISFLDQDVLAHWKDQRWKRRGEAYESLKMRISEALLSFIEQRYPNFRSLVDYQELGTPLSFEHFAAHPGGAIYGLPAVPQRYRLKWLGIRTPVAGLLLTGSDVCGHGIVGAMMGGVGTAAHVLGGAGFVKILRRAAQSN